MPTNVLLMCALLAIAITSDATILCKNDCKASGRRCSDPYTFQYCMNMTDYAVGTTTAKKCPDGTICTDQGSFPCKVGTVTTTPRPEAVPSCSGPDRFPTDSCNAYFECIQVLWYWELVTQTCPVGQNFDPSLKQCSGTYSCGTTESPGVPKCDGPGRLPGPTNNQYYECELVWFQWHAQLRTCPDGQNYDGTSQGCKGTIITTAAPDVPKCDGPGRLPGPITNQYYECELIWFQWQPQLKVCPAGQNYDGTSQQCVGTSNVVTTIKNTPSTTPSTGVEPPQCNGSGRFPGPTTNQYYECVLIWFQWQVELKTCPNGQIFDTSSTQCVTATKNLTQDDESVPSVLTILRKIFKGQ